MAAVLISVLIWSLLLFVAYALAQWLGP